MSESQVLRNDSQNDDGNMGVKLYNLILILLDISVIFIKWWVFTIESIYLAFFPPEEVSVKDEVVLVTGAGHGIGRELALRYGRLGAKVVCWDINEKGNQETVQEIKSQGGKAFAYKCDVSGRQDILDVAKRVKQEVGVVTILVNNAGIMPTHPLLSHTEEEIRKMYDINVLAHFWTIQAFLPDMMEKKHGHIVALSSCAGLFGLKNLVPYCGTKYAVRGIMQALAEELRIEYKDTNIKFTCIYPYMVDTGLCKRPHARFANFMRLVKKEEAADAIVQAQRRGIEEVSIPRQFYYIDKIGRLFPKKAAVLMADFLNSGVDSDL